MPRTELLHPMLVHFPIALFLSVLAFEAIYQITQKQLYQDLALGNLTIASLGALVAALFGELSENIIPHNEQIHELMQTHELLGWITVGVFTILTVWGYLRRFRRWPQPRVLYWVVLLIGAAVITYGATLGGTMVFEHGAAVEPMYDQLRHAEEGQQHTHGSGEEHSDPTGADLDTTAEQHEHQDDHTH